MNLKIIDSRKDQRDFYSVISVASVKGGVATQECSVVGNSEIILFSGRMDDGPKYPQILIVLCDLTHKMIFLTFGIFICLHCLPQDQSKGVKVKSLTAFEVVSLGAPRSPPSSLDNQFTPFKSRSSLSTLSSPCLATPRMVSLIVISVVLQF